MCVCVCVCVFWGVQGTEEVLSEGDVGSVCVCVCVCLSGCVGREWNG